MMKSTILLENDDIEFVRSQGYSLSGFIRFKISELKKDQGFADPQPKTSKSDRKGAYNVSK